ncbi:MAG: Rne/Rng family ribonuclease [Candidatus Obscuribacterales bacterium]|nr:Rne/Rng family ribonuclease [Candidatus Obscuribacterales bacterium]
MKKSLVISEHDSIAGILENDRVVEFFVNRGELLLGDIYSATVENILPGIDAAFVNLGKDKMGFLHANDVPGQGALKERLVPKQKLLVQITKEPTGHKGPRVSTAISLPGRFLVLVPEERGVSISRRISEARERARLKSVVNLMKPPGIGLIIRTEAKGQGEGELFEDFEQLWDRWQTVVSEGEASIGPTLIYRDQDLLFRVIRDAYSNDVSEIICDTADGQKRAQEYLQGWAGKTTKVTFHTGEDSLLVNKGIDREIEAALSDRTELPSGGHLNIQPTEALTVIDVNSGRFTSSRTQAETVRRTNLEAAQEIPRQLRLRNIGGMVIVDFIDMDSRKDQQQVLEVFQRVLEEDRAKPQVGQLSDLGLVELTRRRQGQSLRELFTSHCNSCSGMGVIPNLELGTGENRRIISFKTRDEEAAARSRGRKGAQAARQAGGGMLRSATASDGRVMPTVSDHDSHSSHSSHTLHDSHDLHDAHDDEDLLAGVPEDILAQMPDDLLQAPGKASGGKFGAYSKSHDEDDENEVDEPQQPEPRKSALEQLGIRRDAYAGKASMHDADNFEDEEENPLSRKLSQNISAVAQVVQDMDSRAARFEISHTDKDDEQNDSHSHTRHERAEKPEHLEHVEHKEDAQHREHHERENDDVLGRKHEVHHQHDSADNGTESQADLDNASDTDDVADEVPFEVNDPFETEYDPATGVYRLKVKAAAPVESQEHAHTHTESKDDDDDEVVVGSSHQPWSGQQLTIPVYEGNEKSQNSDDSSEPVVGSSHGSSEHEEEHDAESESEVEHQEVVFNHHDAS